MVIGTIPIHNRRPVRPPPLLGAALPTWSLSRAVCTPSGPARSASCLLELCGDDAGQAGQGWNGMPAWTRRFSPSSAATDTRPVLTSAWSKGWAMTDFGAHMETDSPASCSASLTLDQFTKSQLRFGTHGSLAVEIDGEKRGTWFDHETKEGGGVLDLLRVKAGLSNGEALDRLRDIGIDVGKPEAASGKWKFVADYHYQDLTGAVQFRVCRWLKSDGTKTFSQERADGKGGWIKGRGAMKGVTPVPYHLPELVAAVGRKMILIPEGEKDVDALRRMGNSPLHAIPVVPASGLPVSPNTSGTPMLMILPDNDKAGRDHTEMVASSSHSVAARIRVLDMPEGTPEKGVSPWWIEKHDTTAEQIGAMLGGLAGLGSSG